MVFRKKKKHLNSRGRRSILKYLKNQIHNRLEQVRDTHFMFNRRLLEANQPIIDAYYYILCIETRVREALNEVDHDFQDRRSSPFSTVSRGPLSQADEESFFTAGGSRSYNPQHQPYDSVPRHPVYKANNQYGFGIPQPILPPGNPARHRYDPRSVEPLGRGYPTPPLVPPVSSDD